VNGHGKLLASIGVDASQYALITYENIVGFKNTVANTDINFIDITLTDESANILDSNGVDVCLTLQIDTIIHDFENNSDLKNLFNKQNNSFNLKKYVQYNIQSCQQQMFIQHPQCHKN